MQKKTDDVRTHHARCPTRRRGATTASSTRQHAVDSQRQREGPSPPRRPHGPTQAWSTLQRIPRAGGRSQVLLQICITILYHKARSNILSKRSHKQNKTQHRTFSVLLCLSCRERERVALREGAGCEACFGASSKAARI